MSAVKDMAMVPAEKAERRRDLPTAVQERNITAEQWNTLTRSLYPGANPMSVLLVWDYCKARRLDPLKKPCHIVPMEVKDAKTGKYEWRDVVMPGIYELRTTAQRTEEYLGHSKAVYGPVVTIAGVEAPEWCEMTIYRWNSVSRQRVEFPVSVFFKEVVATKRSGEANSRWSKAPVQMLTKCCEAAGLREAFPDEIGGEQTAEEMEGQRAIERPIESAPVPEAPDGFEEWLIDLESTAESGLVALEAAWAASSVDHRNHLTATDAAKWDRLKASASGVQVVDAEPSGEEPPL